MKLLKASLYFTFFVAILLLGLWLMWSTVQLKNGFLVVSSKFWSDFGSHVALVRSFSIGQNWPPEYPLYPNTPIQYHFLFYAQVGLLEKIGLPLDVALNVPSTLGFFAMLVLVAILAKKITSSKSVAVLSVLFALFNGSLSWVEFLQKYKIADLWSLQNFVSFGPWNGSEIGAFWSLNIFTNQRHLAFAFAISLVCIYGLYAVKKRLLYLTGFFLGMLLWVNIAAFAITSAFAIWFFLTNKNVRKQLIISLIGTIPWAVGFFMYISPPSTSIQFHPGFLFNDNWTLPNIARYWVKNLGLHLVLIPLGLILAPRKAKIFLLPLLGLIIVPNLFQFSPDMFNNHKFFNFFILLGGIFSAYAIVRLRWVGVMLVPLLIAGGIVDIMPLKNDTTYTLADYSINPDSKFFLEHTPPNAVVLNSTWFYHPASLAGRKIFNGYPYFTWSYGYDQVSREQVAQEIFQSLDTQTACAKLRESNISHIELSPYYEQILTPNQLLWDSWSAVYKNAQSGLTVYSVESNCQTI